MSETTTVNVTIRDIRHGIAGCGFNCALARALQRDTGDTHANVHSHDWQLRIEVWGRSVRCDWSVAEFVRTFDNLPRVRRGPHKGRPRIPAGYTKPGAPLAPFSFDLEARDDPEWQEACRNCGNLFDTAELDDDGYCEECR